MIEILYILLAILINVIGNIIFHVWQDPILDHLHLTTGDGKNGRK